MKLPALAIRNAPFTVVMITLLTLLGVVSFATMPRAEDPQFEIASSTVVAVYPGASPEDLESLVVDPLEDEINELDDLKLVESTIQDGVAQISVEFITGTDPDEAYDDVIRAVNTARPELPPELVVLDVLEINPVDVNILQLALVSETAEYRTLEEVAERLEQGLERVSGVKGVDTWAYPDPEVRISVDLEALGDKNLSLGQVIQAVQTSSRTLPGGSADLGARRFSIQTSGEFDSVDEIRRTVVTGAQGGLVYVSDVAEVQPAYADDTHRARYMGERAVFVTAVKRKEANIFDVVRGMQPVIDEAVTQLPADVRMETVFEQASSVEARVGGFTSSLLQGILLVGIVILIAMGVRSALIVVAAIPISIFIAIAAVDTAGYALQQISIVGLVIALGLLVDNAIVVTENIGRFLKPGVEGEDAAIRGTKEVAWAVVAATVTTILSFVPMASIQTTSGTFIRSLPVTVVFALAASLLVSLVLTPLLASRVLKVRPAERRPPRFQRAINRLIEGPYRRTLRGALRRPLLSLGVAFSIFFGSLALFPLIGVTLFPKAEKPQFLVDIETPEGTSLEQTDRVTRHVEAVIAERPEVVRYAANVGRDNPLVYYNVIPRREKSTVAQVLVELEAYAQAATVIPALKAEFATVPGARIEFVEFENGPPVEAPVAIKVLGPDLAVLERIAGDVEEIIRRVPGSETVDNPLRTPKTDLFVEINRDKAGLLGIPLADIDQTVRAGMAGVPIATYRDASGKDQDVVVRLPLDGRPSTADFDRIAVTSRQGEVIPLRQVADLTFKAEPKRINHYNFERAATVTSGVQDGFTELDVTASVVEQLDAYAWPAGYRYVVGGTFEEQREGFGGLLQALLIALLGIFGVLVLQFRSFSQPLIIFAAIPLAVIGAILGLFATGYTFSFTAFIGLTSLVGIVINNSIILVDYANRLIERGHSMMEAVAVSAETRFTPIVLTTLTTIGGLLPLTLTGSSLWTPLGVVIISGLAMSTFLTLVVVPVLYKLFTREVVPA
ncbi:MAG: efflux RND transporter permease subunit [Bacteroidota bacterium]